MISGTLAVAFLKSLSLRLQCGETSEEKMYRCHRRNLVAWKAGVRDGGPKPDADPTFLQELRSAAESPREALV